MIRVTSVLLVICMAFWPIVALAVQPDEVLSDAALEHRARAISQGLRCVVCQNQSIDDSNAPLARDLRIIVRERLSAGDTDQQTIDHIVARYGNFVLLKPPMAANTLVLWYGPAVLALLALGIAVGYLRRKPEHAAEPLEPLNDNEEARLAQLLGDDKI